MSIAAEVMVIICKHVENLVGKGENAGYQHFLLFSQGVHVAVTSMSLKLRIL